MQYRGGTRIWSNRYYLSTSSIDTLTHYNTLSDAIVNAEKLIYASNVTITGTIGYNGGSDLAAYSKSYSTAGTWTPSGNACPGQTAALARWSTSARSSKNHPIYLFAYYHGVWNQAGTSVCDLQVAAQKTLMETYATAWVTGFSDGVTTYKKAGPFGHTATGSLLETYLTHRDFPR